MAIRMGARASISSPPLLALSTRECQRFGASGYTVVRDADLRVPAATADTASRRCSGSPTSRSRSARSAASRCSGCCTRSRCTSRARASTRPTTAARAPTATSPTRAPSGSGSERGGSDVELEAGLGRSSDSKARTPRAPSRRAPSRRARAKRLVVQEGRLEARRRRGSNLSSRCSRRRTCRRARLRAGRTCRARRG